MFRPITPKDSPQQPAGNPRTLESHHKSPQNPKIDFFHSQVVQPLRVTFQPTNNRLPTILLKNTPAEARQQLADRKKPHPRWDGAREKLCRRSPNLPHTYACSTIGPTRLNFRVRDGNGCDPRGKLTGKVLKSRSRDLPQLNRLE